MNKGLSDKFQVTKQRQILVESAIKLYCKQKECIIDNEDNKLMLNMVAMVNELIDKAMNAKIIVWGTGSTGKMIADLIGSLWEIGLINPISYYVSNDDQIDYSFEGAPVCKPSILSNEKDGSYIIVIASMYFQEIEEYIKTELNEAILLNCINGYNIHANIESLMRNNSHSVQSLPAINDVINVTLINQLKDIIESCKNKKVILFGGSSCSELIIQVFSTINHISKPLEFAYAVSLDQNEVNKILMNQHAVLHADALRCEKEDIIILVTEDQHNEIGFVKSLNICNYIDIRPLCAELNQWLYGIEEYKTNHLFENKYQEILEQIGNIKAKRVIIAFSVMPWESRRQRPQHILERFSQNDSIIIFISTRINKTNKVFSNEAMALEEIEISKIKENIFQVHFSMTTPLNIYSDMISLDDVMNSVYQLKGLLELFKKRMNLYYLVQFPNWGAIPLECRNYIGGKVIYDCMDDHQGFTTTTKFTNAIEFALLENSDVVVVSSELLYKKCLLHNKNVFLIRNGTEYHHFANAQKNGKLDELQKEYFPIIGYYGAISDWFDIDLIGYCAEQKPDWNFVLIGNTWGCDVSKVEKYKNIYFLGEIDYGELPGYAAYFDVCLIPFKINSLTQATNPVKFYEYLSLGKPVVAVDLPELRPYNTLCSIAKSKEEFLESISKLLVSKDGKRSCRRTKKGKEFAEKQTWDIRYKDYTEFIL